MIFAKNTKSKTVFALSLAILLCFTSVFAYARYAKSVSVSTVYTQQKSYTPTMDTSAPVYDFGVYVSGDEGQFDSTICIDSKTAVNGTLAFSWDKDTAAAADVAVAVEGYSPDANGRYKISAKERMINIPFSLILNATTRVGRAYLDVSWTPASESEPTLFAKYLISLNPFNESAEKPQIIANKTGFITNSLFTVGALCDGDVLVSRGMGLNEKFEKGTVYCSVDYPDGVTLLCDSLISLKAPENGVVGAMLKLKMVAQEDMSISIGGHSLSCVSTTSAPASVSTTIQADFDGKLTKLGINSPLTLTVTEGYTFVDSVWNDTALEGAQLKWSVERYDGKKFVAVTPFATSDGNKIKLSLQDEKQPAGTYRLVILQTYNGFTISKLDKVFFIDYR